jgi:Xaa-Pro aminopeptidase
MPSVPREEYTSRVEAARRLMKERRIDGLIVTDPVNYYYFSGHAVPAWMKARPSIFILPLSGLPAIVNWSGPEMFCRVYNRPYPSWVEDRRIYPEIPFNSETRVDWGLKDVLVERGLEGATLGIELGRETSLAMPLDDFFLLREQLPKARFVDSGPVTWGCRIIKSSWEIECSRQACAIGGAAWKRCLDALRPGVTGAEIQKTILGYYYEGGADLTSEPPTALGAKGPGGTFQNGDVLYLDGGCSYMGYRMDFTRRAVFGKPSERQRHEHDGMWDILFKVMDRMKPGVPTTEIFAFSQSLLAKTKWHNYSDHPAKRIGHGIGLETEPPSLNAFDPYILQEGMVITPEPKIESPDGLVNPEEHVVIRRDGCEILSTNPDWQLRVIE